ncbi:MAG: ribose 5-phosphate isomerase B [Deltaproteobacteria bacterium]|nr:MAG: ribose 5-phosphate isomerase B [Deltaproteobacteria bacterium]
MPTIAVGSDHAAIAMRQAIATHLAARGIDVIEVGPGVGEKSDYPDQAHLVASAVVRHEADLGILCCGTGIGMSIAANKVAGIRAALVHDPVTARLAAQHNAANVLCLGGRLLAEDYANELVDHWLDTAFEARHQGRLDKIAALESSGA